MNTAITAAASAPSEGPVMDPDEARALASRMALRAFRIATLGTVGLFGFAGALGFYASGCRSLDEAVQGTKIWASSCRRSIEQMSGKDSGIYETHPDLIATQDMTGDEELQYLFDKYISEKNIPETTTVTQGSLPTAKTRNHRPG
jgi:hypothetical protein